MDCVKIGQLIRKLRSESGLTQLQLAEQMHVSDKAVSKWERGCGCPDVSLLTELSRFFHVDIEKLLSGDLNENEITGGNMKKLRFYVCPNCGNIISSATDAVVSCCGKKLQGLVPQKAEGEGRLSVELIENDYFVTSGHPMRREHYISFAALLTGDTLILRKLYPEWDMQIRFPAIAHGRLLWYCTQHGLFYREV